MNTSFEICISNRKLLLNLLNSFSTEQLNNIPAGFSNNLIWNIGHVVVVQQLLIYKLSGLPMMVSDVLVEKYKKGSLPSNNVTEEEINEIKSLLFVTIDQTVKDVEANLFKNYNEFTSMSGFTMRNYKDAIEFNNFHEGIHTGIMLQIKKHI